MEDTFLFDDEEWDNVFDTDEIAENSDEHNSIIILD